MTAQPSTAAHLLWASMDDDAAGSGTSMPVITPTIRVNVQPATKAPDSFAAPELLAAHSVRSLPAQYGGQYPFTQAGSNAPSPGGDFEGATHDQAQSGQRRESRDQFPQPSGAASVSPPRNAVPWRSPRAMPSPLRRDVSPPPGMVVGNSIGSGIASLTSSDLLYHPRAGGGAPLQHRTAPSWPDRVRTKVSWHQDSASRIRWICSWHHGFSEKVMP